MNFITSRLTIYVYHTNVSYQENALENTISKMSAILFKPKYLIK